MTLPLPLSWEEGNRGIGCVKESAAWGGEAEAVDNVSQVTLVKQQSLRNRGKKNNLLHSGPHIEQLLLLRLSLGVILR